MEGLDIIYWPNISIWPGTQVNQTQNLVLFYYLIDPSGKKIDGPPIFITDASIIGDSITSPYAIAGIGVPSSYPGIWEIRSILVDMEDYLNNSDYFREKYTESLFSTERVHVLSYNEYVNERIAKNSLYVAIFALLITIFLGFLPLYRDYRKQISLLESLYSELDAISSEEKRIRLSHKEKSIKGNLQWVEELFGWGLKPAHGIWKLNTQIYVAGLNEKIKFKKTKSLKRFLILISQKIELIENYLLQFNQVPKETDNVYKEAIMKVFAEVIELVETTKTFIEKEFRITKE
jgi:hypothetical protein